MTFDVSRELASIIIQLVPLKHRYRVFELISAQIIRLLQPRFVVIFPSSYGFRQRFLHYSPIFLGDVPSQLISLEYEKHLESLLLTMTNTPVINFKSFSEPLLDFLSYFSLRDVNLCVQIRTHMTFHGIIFIGPPVLARAFSELDHEFLLLLSKELVMVFERILSLEDLNEANRQLELLNAQLQRKMNSQAIELSQAQALHQRAGHYKTDFLAKVTHDLRTPLQVIKGLTYAMLSDEMGVSDAINLLRGSVDRLRYLLDNVLNLESHHSSHNLIHYQEVDLRLFLMILIRRCLIF